MLATILPLHTSLTSVVGLKCQFLIFSESCHVAYLINGNEAENTMQANSLHFYMPATPEWGQKVKTNYEGHVAYQIKGKKCRTLCK